MGKGGGAIIAGGGATGRHGGACFAVVWHPAQTNTEPTKTATIPRSLIDIDIESPRKGTTPIGRMPHVHSP
jgi:hypothetical protein